MNEQKAYDLNTQIAVIWSIEDVQSLNDKVFEIEGYFIDDKSSIDGELVTDFDETPEGYEDEDIFFYGLSENELIGDQGDFTITTYRKLEDKVSSWS